MEKQQSMSEVLETVEPVAEMLPEEETDSTGDAPEVSEEREMLERLVGEVAELRQLLNARAASPSSSARALSEGFRALYPEVSEADVPDAVWESVREGLPPEAAYALWERRELVRRKAAEEANRKNADGAWGRADTAAEGHFSPDEVRRMTPREVRENYGRIIESMKHWN